MSKALQNAIIQKYIVPTERKATDLIGVEFEFPLVNLKKEPVNLPEVQKVVKAFSEAFQFTDQKKDADGNLYSLTQPQTGDNLSFDCSYNTLELSFGTEDNIHKLNERFRVYFSKLQELLKDVYHALTGMGIHPYSQYNENQPIANDRYRMLHHHLYSYQKYGDVFYHDIPNFNMIAAASQVQLDVQKEDITKTLHTFNRLEPFKAVLFANSYYDQLPNRILSRDYLWRYSSQGYNPHNLGMYEIDFRNLDEYVDYIQSQSIYCVQKGDKYLHFKPIPLYRYVNLDSVTGSYFDGTWKTFTFQPEIEDIAHHRSFKFSDLTYRGTIEFRSACEQPIKEVFTHAAFHVGLSKKLDELTDLLDNDSVLYAHGYTASELRELFTYRNIPEFVDKQKLSKLLLQILELAKAGLLEKGYQEEIFLAPLFERAERLTNPALDFLNGIENGDTLESWIFRYGT
ncbi:MAG: glutamate-cysteine ligase family protein [Oscillospiraceae bacterium]